MTHGDGGKGDKQRPTDHNAFANNFDRIFGGRKRQIAELVEQDNKPEPEDEERTNDCPRCNTEMSITGTHLHWHCDVCGWMEKIERGEP